MSAVAGSLMKRGMEAHSYLNDKEVKINLPDWAIVMLVSTAVLFFGLTFMVEYTFGRVIPTLLMIESPQDNINFEPLPTEDTDDSINKNPDNIRFEGRPQFITSSFRKSIQLLHSKGGFRARFRGFSIFLANSIAVQWIAGLLNALPILRLLPIGFTAVVASILCAQLSLGWTLIVISEPSPKTWFRRVPSFKMWKKIVGPTALYALLEQASVMIPLYLAIGAGLTKDPNDVVNMSDRAQKALILKSFGIGALGLLLAIAVVIPARVALTRVQASLISEAEETIVPFDRTFGGKVVPEIVGGSGMIGLLDAWKTFDGAARVRLIKAYLKVIAMVIGVSVVFTVIFTCQILAVGGASKIIVPADGKN